MATLDSTSTLADLVITYPSLITVMEDFGLDYCCGGQSRLVDAVDAADLNLDTVVDALSSALAAPAPLLPTIDCSLLGADELVDHIESTHHTYLRGALSRLSGLVDKVSEVHGDRHPELAEVRVVFHDLRGDLEPHLMQEERVVFPMIRELVAATPSAGAQDERVRTPITVLMAEHDRAGELLAHLRRLTDNYRVPDDGCASYQALYDGLVELEADIHLHVHKENNILFPQVLAAETALADRG